MIGCFYRQHVNIEKIEILKRLNPLLCRTECIEPISMPVTIALFDLGTPDLPDENSVKGGEADGVSVPPVKTIEEYTQEDWENFEPFS